jgi:hypothetical protein
VPTCVAVGPDGAYYVGELTGVPFAAGAARVYRVVPGQAPQVVHTGFKTIIDIDFGPDGSLYVLQIATGAFLSGSGALIRVAPDGTRTTVASEGLVSPTSVLVGDDGTIYVSNRGTSVGIGEVVRVTPTPPAVAPARAPGSLAGSDWALSVPSGQGALPGAKADSRLTDAGPPPRHEATGPDRSAVAEATGDRAAAPAGSPSLHANRPESGLADWPGAWPGDDDIFNPIVV